MNATLEIDSSRRRNAFLTSVVVHAALVALLFLLKIVTPIPPFEPGGGPGMELGIADLGFSDEGMGNEEVMDAGAESTPAEPAPSETGEDELIAEDDGEEISQPAKTDPKKPNDKPRETPKPKEPVIKEPTVNPNALFSPSKGSSSNTQPGKGGDGNSNTPGNVGVPGGDPSGSGVFGGGVGSYRLNGRGIGHAPGISEKPSEGGKVVLNIWVDRNGKVLRATQNLDKSTTTSQMLVNIARKHALLCTYTAKPDAPAEQMGEMAYNFILE